MRMFEKKYRFVPEMLTETGAVLANPARGWYQVYAFDAAAWIDLDTLFWCLSEEDALALVLFDIGAFREKALSAEVITRLDTLLAFLKAHSKDIILRIVYDREGNGFVREPRTIEQIEQHMRQLGPVIRRHAAAILVVQGLFVGSWGEMHSSAYVSPAYLRRLAGTFLAATDGAVPIAVRTPAQWRMLCRPQEKARQIALFDDAMFASDTHLGTFARQTDRLKQWETAWEPKEELSFWQEHLLRMPNGGEALYGEQLTLEETIRQLQCMHVCYLNRVYEERRLVLWKTEHGAFAKPYDGLDGFSYIGRHLGYRFVVEGVRVKRKKGDRMRYAVFVQIANRGFGNLCQPADCTLLIRDLDGEETRYAVDCDARCWDSKSSVTLQTEISLPLQTEKEGKEMCLYIVLARSHDGRVIRFANTDSGEGVLLGRFVI